MKIAVLRSVPVPMARGGQDRLIEGLQAALSAQHATEIVDVPVDERDEAGVLRGYHDFYNLDVSAYDLVISTKAPTFMVRHPVHVPYLLHRMRVFYDLYEPRDAQFARMRRLIHWLDSWGLAPERTPEIFTNGHTVSQRLLRWGGIPSTPIHHPTTFVAGPAKPGEHLLAVGRLHPWKRFDLIIRAMRASRADVPLVIAGTGPHEKELRDLADGDSRISFTGELSEETLRDLYARSIASIFPPINEDLGLITFESFLSGKPVVTASDSGEPTRIIREGVTGWICEPTPASIAQRLDWIAGHRGEVEAMGPACLEAIKPITWDNVTGSILDAAARRRESLARVATPGRAPVAREAAKPEERIRVVVTDNQIIDPPVGGGRVRIWELYRNLPDDFSTVYVGTHDHPGPRERDQMLAPNFREVIMPLTTLHFKAHEAWRRMTRGDATIDVTIPLLLGRCSPRYLRLIRRHAEQADVLVTSHPWMTRFVPKIEGVPFVYDSHNCEAAAKGPLLKRTAAGRYLAGKVESVEAAALARSALALACSHADAEQFVERYNTPPEKILLIPNGVDCMRIAPANPMQRAEARGRLENRIEAADRPLAIFIGSDYPPNVDAVNFIIREVAPTAPGVVFALIGGAIDGWRILNPAVELPPNVRPAGIVSGDDLLLFLQAADLALNPMMHGSGTNIKMLDTMAAALPIITTPTGARGLEGRPGEHWIEAPREEFPRLLGELAADPALAASLAANARRLAENNYDWPIIAARYAQTLRSLLTSSANRRAEGRR